MNTTVYYASINIDRYKSQSHPDYKKASVSYVIDIPLKPYVQFLVENRGKDDSFLSCPAFLDYYKNTFVICSPVDFELKFVDKEITFVKPLVNESQQLFNHLIETTFNRTKEQPVGSKPLISMGPMYFFFSPDDTMVELLPPNLLSTSGLFSITSGTFNINKWLRPIDWTFEVIDPSKNFTIKRGDPLFLVKFITKNNSKVSLVRVDEDDDIEIVIKSISKVNDFFKKLTLQERYDMASEYVKLFLKKKNLKKSKCPFNFLRRG